MTTVVTSHIDNLNPIRLSHMTPAVGWTSHNMYKPGGLLLICCQPTPNPSPISLPVVSQAPCNVIPRQLDDVIPRGPVNASGLVACDIVPKTEPCDPEAITTCDVATEEASRNLMPGYDVTTMDVDGGERKRASSSEEDEAVGCSGESGATSGTAPRTRRCQVCDQNASGNFFGASVCLPCKTFFIRCSGEDVNTFRCRNGADCDIRGMLRSRCKACRYAKCIDVGMSRKERPEQVEPSEGQQLCVVCGDLANGVHFGVISCEGCKKFFRRGLLEYTTYVCKNGRYCVINPRTRNECRFCRYQKCLSVGMSRKAIKMGRPRKDSHHWLAGSELASPPSPTSHRYHPYDVTSAPQDPLHRRLDSINIMPPLNYGGCEERQSFKVTPKLISMKTKSDGQGYRTDSSLHHKRSSEDQDTDWNSGSSSGYISDTDDFVESPQHYSSHLPQTNPFIPHAPAQITRQPKITGVGHKAVTTISTLNKDMTSIGPRKDEVRMVSRQKRVMRTVAADDVTEMGRASCCGSTDNCDTKIPEATQASEDCTPSHAELSDKSVKCASKQVDCILQYRFPAKYWLKMNLPEPEAGEDEEHSNLCDHITQAYRQLADNFLSPSEDSLGGNTREMLTQRIVNHTCLVMAFVQDIPGFNEVAAVDKYTIFRLTGVQLSILVAAQTLYDEESNTFIRNFYEEDLPATDPLYHFRNSVLDYATQIQALNLSEREMAIFLALVAIATDWPDLQFPSTLEDMFQTLLKTFVQCVREVNGGTTERVHRILSYVPRLRQLGQWHYELTLKDVLAHF